MHSTECTLNRPNRQHLTNCITLRRQHLFRCHRIFQCERCNELFRDEQELEKHFMAVKACELQPPVPADGITEAVDKRLRSRKKTHREQSADERWKEIYGILFPNQIVPSPCKFTFLLRESPQSVSSLLQTCCTRFHPSFGSYQILQLHRLRTTSR